jgi:L-rhamnose mutarotase
MSTQGNIVTHFGRPVQRYVQTLQLRDNPELIARYRELHDRHHNPALVRQGIRAVGLLEMDIYLRGTTLVMIAEAPVGFDWDKAMARLAKKPGQSEWEDTVAPYQKCAPGSASHEKWQMMERIFHLYENEATTE